MTAHFTAICLIFQRSTSQVVVAVVDADIVVVITKVGEVDVDTEELFVVEDGVDGGIMINDVRIFSIVFCILI